MYRREIKFTNLDGEPDSDVFYFNLSKHEVIELQVSVDGGIDMMIKRITEAKDFKTLIEQFKRLVLISYGVRSEDGKRFVKNDKLREEFEQHPAFDELFMELATKEGAADTFIKAVAPMEMLEELNKQLSATVPPPPPPPSLQITENVKQ